MSIFKLLVIRKLEVEILLSTASTFIGRVTANHDWLLRVSLPFYRIAFEFSVHLCSKAWMCALILGNSSVPVCPWMVWPLKLNERPTSVTASIVHHPLHEDMPPHLSPSLFLILKLFLDTSWVYPVKPFKNFVRFDDCSSHSSKLWIQSWPIHSILPR